MIYINSNDLSKKVNQQGQNSYAHQFIKNTVPIGNLNTAIYEYNHTDTDLPDLSTYQDSRSLTDITKQADLISNQTNNVLNALEMAKPYMSTDYYNQTKQIFDKSAVGIKKYKNTLQQAKKVYGQFSNKDDYDFAVKMSGADYNGLVELRREINREMEQKQQKDKNADVSKENERIATINYAIENSLTTDFINKRINEINNSSVEKQNAQSEKDYVAKVRNSGLDVLPGNMSTFTAHKNLSIYDALSENSLTPFDENQDIEKSKDQYGNDVYNVRVFASDENQYIYYTLNQQQYDALKGYFDLQDQNDKAIDDLNNEKELLESYRDDVALREETQGYLNQKDFDEYTKNDEELQKALKKIEESSEDSILTGDEAKAYVYLNNKYGEEKANEYLGHIPTNKRQSEITQRQFYEFGQEHPIVGSAMSVILSPARVITFLGNTKNAIFGTNDYYGGATDLVSGARAGVESTIDSEFLKQLYSAGMSLGDMVAAGLLTGGSGTALVLAGGAAGTQSQNLLNKGASNWQAVVGGAVSGAFEYAFEKISIGSLLKNVGKVGKVATTSGKVRQAITAFVKESGVNWSEETATEVANSLYDILANGDYSDYNQSVLEYQKQGYTKEEAENMAVNDMKQNIIDAGISGLLMGQMAVAGGTVFHAAKYAGQSYSIGKQVMDQGLTDNTLSVAREFKELSKNADEVETAIENGKSKTAISKLGRLYLSTVESVQTQAYDSIKTAASAEMKRLGVSQDKITKAVNILNKAENGEKLTSKDISLVQGTAGVQQVFTDIALGESDQQTAKWYTDATKRAKQLAQKLDTPSSKKSEYSARELLDMYYEDNKIKQENKQLVSQLSEMGLSETQAKSTADIIQHYRKTGTVTPKESKYLAQTEASRNAFNQIVGTNSITGYVQPQEQETPTFKNVPVNKDADSKFEEPNLNSQSGVSFIDSVANEMNGVPINEPAAMKVQDVASKLGLSIVWDIKGDPEKVGYGYIKGNVIHLNPKINNPIFTVFKHEFVHYLENTGKYQAFADYVKTTDVFKNWIRKVGKNKNYSDALQAYRDGIEKIYKGSGKELSYAEIDKEMIANFVGENLFGGKDAKSSEALLKALANEKWYDVIKRWFQRVIAKVGRKSPEAREILKLEDMFTKMYQESKKEGYRHDGVRYYPANSDNTSSIKEQIKAHLDEINKMDPVSNISYTKGTKKELKELAIAEFKKKGYKIDRKGFGIIEIGEKQINDSLNYLNTLGDYAALLAVPDVLKRGKMFSGHDNHKNRSYSSVTFAAPVTINGITGDMAAVVRQTGKNRYYTHRILMPDGSEFVFQNKNEAELTSVDMPVQSAGQGTTIGSASNNKIAQKPPVVNTNIRKNKKNNTSQNYIPVDLEKISYDNLRKMVQDGEMTKDELWESFNQKSGSFDKGAKPRRDIDVPQKVSEKTNVRRAVRTILEDKDVPDEYVAIIKDKVLDDKLSYTVATNEQAEKYATKMLEQGEAQKIWSEVVSGGRKVTKNNIAVGEMLLKSAVDAKDAKEMLRYAAEVSEVGTRLGQAVQAFSLLKKMGGIGELLYIQKAVDTMNRDLEKKYKNNAPQIQIDENLAGRLASAKNTEDSDFAKEEIMRNIGEQVPSTFLDKWNAWRYMSMLLNFRTHLRNFKGNAIFLPFVKIKNAFAYAIERVLPDSIINESQYTKSLTIDKKYKDFAREDFENDDVQNALTGGGKMNPAKELEKYKRIFKSNALEKARKFNFDALEKEDSIFLKMHYIRSLGEVLQARKIDLDNITQEQLFSAREYAIQEAKKATYRDTSDFANLLNRLSNSNKAANIIVEGLLPFKKTPINVVKRGMEYSPVGLIKTLSKGMYDLKKGKINISEFCDGLASGLTGTGIMAVGMLLQALGVISVGFGGDDEDWFKQLNGEQEYSIQIFGKSYTIDWAAPACIPFFIGAELQKALNEDNENFVSAFTNCMTSAFEPIINLSMLQGINDTLNSIKYSDDPFGDTLIDLIQSYFMQAIPTLGGQISRTIDGTRRANYIDKNSPVPEVVQSLWNAITSKVPGLSYTKQPYVDEWGREEKDGNIITRLFLNMISPGYYSDITYDATNREIQRVYDQTGENKVFPSKPDKYIKVDGETKYLTAEEYTELSKKQGEYANNILSQAIEKDAYKNMSDLDKADFISKVYSYSKAKSKYDVLGYEIPDNSEMAKYVAFDEAGADMGDAFIGGLVQSSEQADTNNDGTITKDEKIEAIRNSDIKDDFTKELWEYFLQRQSNRNGKPMDEFVGDLAKRIKQ